MVKILNTAILNTIHNTIRRIDPNEFSFVNKAKKLSKVLNGINIDDLLKKYVFDKGVERLTKSKESILDFNKDLHKIPMIILLIKYLQLWKKVDTPTV